MFALTHLLVWIVTLGLLAGCGTVPTSLAYRNDERRLEGFFGVVSVGRPSGMLAWADEDSVLFVGTRPGAVEPRGWWDTNPPLKRFLFRWKFESREVQTIAELREHGSFCYDRGFIRYGARVGDRVVVREGPIGSERDVLPNSPSTEFRVNSITCRSFDLAEFRKSVRTSALPLRDEHGYWYVVDDSYPANRVVVARTVDGRMVEVLTPMHGVFFHEPKWSESAQGYAFFQMRSSYDKRDPKPGKLWILQPTGQTKEIDLPFGPWLRASHGVELYKRGVFIWSHNSLDGAAGGYVFADGRVDRVIEGWIYAASASPNGCRIALSISNTVEQRSNPEIVVLNLCK